MAHYTEDAGSRISGRTGTEPARGCSINRKLMKTLYVIGNGFDLHHGLSSSYADFGTFLKAHDPRIHYLLGEYFNTDVEFWSHFEARLADLDAAALAENASSFLTPYGADDWKDSAHHDYQFELDRLVEGLSQGLKAQFATWIRQLEVPDPVTIPSRLLRLDASATFLNFNYTCSLQALYGVAPSQVLHIHGSADDVDSDLILGHGWNPKERGSSNDGTNLEEADMREVEGNGIIDSYFERTFKPTDCVIAAHQSFFEGLQGTHQILVMGHSMEDVDFPYFKEIIRHIDVSSVRWRVSYHVADDAPKFRQQLEKRGGVSARLVELARLAEL